MRYKNKNYFIKNTPNEFILILFKIHFIHIFNILTKDMKEPDKKNLSQMQRQNDHMEQIQTRSCSTKRDTSHQSTSQEQEKNMEGESPNTQKDGFQAKEFRTILDTSTKDNLKE